MKQEIEEVIKKNLPEKKEIKSSITVYSEEDLQYSQERNQSIGFNQALAQINTSLIADEVLKVVVEILPKKRLLTNYITNMCSSGVYDTTIPHTLGYNQALEEIIQLLTNSSTLEGEQGEHLSPNKENK